VFWAAIQEAAEILPGFWAALESVRSAPAGEIHQAAWLARQVRLKGIGHLHAHFATDATGVARLAARFAGVPYSFTAHAKDIFHQGVDPAELRRKLAEAAAVITVSEFNLKYLQETYGLAAAGVRRVYNGLDLAEFPYASPEDRAPRIVAVGRLVEKKGFADLIDACALLTRRRRVHCQIIGTGELEAELRAQVARLGLEGTVELLGPRPQSEVIGLVQGAALLAAPCVVGNDGNRDGLPTVLLEAMALGTPCVSTDVTGIPEVVQDGQTGLTVAQHDPGALATAADRLLGDGALRVRLAGNARRLIEQEFDVHRNAARLRAIFQRQSDSASAQASRPFQEVS
jgi:glycosyltransferase involved in cell wall biosynthesis